MQRRGVPFKAGQHILLGKAGSIHNREYSIYSGDKEDFIEVLVKEVEEGLVSRQLKKSKIGENMQIEGPLGFFTIETELINNAKFLFIATGSGIAPFHSFVKSYPAIDYKVLHGIRRGNEAYGKQDFNKKRYISCTSGDNSGDFRGRVTEYIKQNPVENDTHCYLCGNFNMIHEVFDLLELQNIPPEQIHAEVYF
jgi:ferredoxin--NADP+ reductase/benzoate/toluate 1,2-dioxygenase reductase subunit